MKSLQDLPQARPKHSPLGLILVVLMVTSWVLWTSRFEYPVLDGDAKYFLPVAVSYAHDHRLENPLWHPPRVYDQEHPQKYNWHGFLYPMVLAVLAWVPDYAGIRAVITAIWIGCFIIYGICYYRCAVNWGASNRWGQLLVGLGLLGLAGQLPDGGRPELLVDLWLACGLTLAIFLPLKWHWLILGMVTGLVAATSPVAAILTFLSVGMYACSRLPLKHAALFLVLSGLAAAVVFAVCFAFYPYSLKEWLGAMSFHAQAAVVRSRKMTWLIKIHQDPAIILFALLATAACACGVLRYFKSRRELGNRSGLIVFTLLLLGGIYYFSLRNIDQNYNVTVFSPVLIFLLLVYAAGSGPQKEPFPLDKFICAGIGVILTMASFQFFKTALIFPFFVKDGVSYSEAANQWRLLTESEKGKVGISSAFFALSTNFSRIHLLPNQTNCAFLFMQQVNQGRLSPPQYEGFTLMRNAFATNPPRVLGIRIANTCGAYNFAIYQQTEKLEK